MFCPNCGTKVGDEDQFCSICGKRITGVVQETELYSFGPMGVGICFRRPTFLTPVIRNSTKVVLTDRRICGYPKGSLIPTNLLLFKDKARFEVLYHSILATEQFGFLVNKVLWIEYRDGEKIKEVSVICSPRISQHISRAYELLQNAKTNRR